MAGTPRPRNSKARKTHGPTGTATRATLSALGADIATDPYAALAVHLADHLDSGEARSQVGAVSRELRATLDAVAARYSVTDDALDAFLAELRGPE